MPRLRRPHLLVSQQERRLAYYVTFTLPLLETEVEADNNFSPVATQTTQNTGPLQRILALLLHGRAIVGAVLTVGCYFIGATYYAHLLGLFHLDSQLFPLDTARYFVMGAMALFHFCANFFEFLNEHPGQSLLGGLGLIVYIAVLAWISSGSSKDSDESGSKNRVALFIAEKLAARHGLRRAMRYVLLSAAGLYLVLFSLLGVMVVIGLPAIIGEVAATVEFRDTVSAYKPGCDSAKRPRCFRLEQDGKPSVEGFVVASSPDQIALYNNGTISVLPLKGNRLISVSPGAKP